MEGFKVISFKPNAAIVGVSVSVNFKFRFSANFSVMNKLCDPQSNNIFVTMTVSPLVTLAVACSVLIEYLHYKMRVEMLKKGQISRILLNHVSKPLHKYEVVSRTFYSFLDSM